ncbi:hypothetical protein NYA30BAC_01361 [Halomonas sp. NYA30]
MKGPSQLFVAATVKQGDYSPMATQENLNRVQELYVAYYGRPADSEGQEYWADRLEAEGEGAIINAFGNSEEYAALAEGQGNATLVNEIYLQAFDRDADPEGLAYYTGVLASGEKTLAEIALTITNAAQGIDRQTFNARVEAAAAYTTEFGAAEDYDLEAAKAAIEEAKPGVDASALTEALETYQAAVTAKSEFLEETAEVEAVADEIVAAGDEPTEEEIETAVGEAVDTSLATLDGANTSKYTSYDLTTASPEALAQMISDIEADLAKEVQDARDEIADSDISGLQTALNALVSAQGRYVSAVDEEEEADLDAQGELAKVIARNAPTLDNADFLVADGDFSDLAEDDVVATTDGAVAAGDGSNVLIAVGANGQLVAGDGADGVDGFAALLSSAQAYVDANVLLEGREESLVEAANRVVDTESGTDGTGTFAVAADVLDADNDIDTTVFNTDAPLAEDFLAAMQNENAFASALEEYQAVKQLADTQEGLNDELEASVDAIEELGYELGDDVGTEASDLFVFTGDEMEVDLFNEAGDDLLFIGTDFELGADIENGNDAALEIFFTQQGDDTVISVEEVAFGSNASTPEVVEITLAGVNAEDLSFNDGYVAVA